MITELQQHNFDKCQPLLNPAGQLEAKAVVSGINPGRIFVDNPDNPESGLIWLGNNDGFIFIGNEKNDQFNSHLHSFLTDTIIPGARKAGLEWFEGMGNHPGWNQTIETVFENRKLGTWEQLVYKIDKLPETAISLPGGYKIEPINNALYNSDNIKNIDFLHSKIRSFWPTPQQFFKNGLGYCIIHNNDIVSICFTGFVHENVHCVDIETAKTHRGKKLAQILAAIYAKECLERGGTAYWDCMKSNKPSVAVAEQTGFKLCFTYTGYEFPF
ncbi:acetyltransferase [Bacillus sp. FJAT-27225]|uniref:GNAT family N-acetyltransferase n=1 Tax=Bacillus sp. FJAT-27225 TaxID=1743144 RepID=UPI00080C2C63|nr:GNAT family N-acetyltransferase [Bacillus sp. FJAT-27225]OCA87932.1 acetyltransferase [Bacillus sp. FJAT-27225]